MYPFHEKGALPYFSRLGSSDSYAQTQDVHLCTPDELPTAMGNWIEWEKRVKASRAHMCLRHTLQTGKFVSLSWK